MDAITRALNPEHLGPLESDPSAPPEGGFVLFPGERRYFGRLAIRRRARFWEEVSRALGPMFQDGEQILHVVPAMRHLTPGQFIGLGIWAYSYNRVALVLTDRRLIEARLDFSGRRLDGAIRSIPWSGATQARIRLGSVRVQPAMGKRAAWTVRQPGDKKLLKRLLPRIEERLVPHEGGGAGEAPRQHCPGCHAETTEPTGPCPSCRELPRSAGLASVLALAFPGAGLFYAGHPLLAAADLAGELLLFLVVALQLLVSPGGATTQAALVVGAVLLLFTKAESVHVSRLMVARGRTEAADRRDRWRRALAPGLIVSGIALAGSIASIGLLADRIENDLVLTTEGWEGTRNPDEWVEFADDPSMRSQWAHEDGWFVFIFAYALGPGETLSTLRHGFLEAEPASRISAEGSFHGVHEGFHAVQHLSHDDGEPYAIVNRFVLDPEGGDVHQLVTLIDPPLEEEAIALLQALEEEAIWTEAVSPR